MPIRIISPVAGEVIQTNTVPKVVTVRAIADSNLNTANVKLSAVLVETPQ